MDWNLVLTLFTSTAAFATGFAWSLLATWPGIRRLRRSVDTHWSERARLVHPYRGASVVVASYLPATLALALQLVAQPSPSAILSTACMASAGAVLGSFPLSRAIDPTFSWRDWPVAFRFWQHPMLLIWATAAAMPREMGVGAWLTVAALASWVVISNLLPARLRFRKGFLTAAPHELQARARALAQQVRAPLRGLHIASKGIPNAYAFPVTGELVVSGELVRDLAPAEIDAVLLHELDHLREPALLTLARVVATNATWVLVFLKPAASAFGTLGIGPIVLVWILVPLGFARWSRWAERKADAQGSSVSPTAYATALLRIHQRGLIPAVLEHPGTHPNLYDRLLACGVTPDFDRPKPAITLTLLATLTSFAFGILLAWSLMEWAKARPE